MNTPIFSIITPMWKGASLVGATIESVLAQTFPHWEMIVVDDCSPDEGAGAAVVEQYAKTFKQAGLRTVEEKDSSNDETFCMTLGFISDYTPEEFYQDKELYADWDKIGEYMERHILRPMINLETGSDIRDKEFFVPEVDEYEEE